MRKLYTFLVALLVTSSILAQYPSLNFRESIPLTSWKFKKGIIYKAQAIDFDDSDWSSVNVPHTYSMDAIKEVGYYRGQAWYRIEQKIPTKLKGKRIYLRFEGVGQEAEVYVNEKKVGKHIGGYSAFCYEITESVDFEKKNTIVVKVSNKPNFKRIPVDDGLFNHYGGIYRPVQLFATAQTNIKPNHFASSGVFVTLKKHNKEKAVVEVKTHISSSLNETSKVSITLKDAQNKIVTDKEITLGKFQKDTTITSKFVINKPNYWQAKTNPYQYTAEISIDDKDKVVQSFGLKSYAIDPEKGFILNKKPYRLYGVCKHQEWKQTGPALEPKHLKKDMELIEEIGATAVRLSHYQHSDLTYQLADKKGILIWTEIPFVHDYSGREGGNAKQQLTELILQNYNHPSIFVWGLWNEVRAWNSPNEPCVTLTKELKELAHQLDPNRLTTSASDRGMESNMGNISDLQAWNKYYGWYYGQYEDMGKWLDDYHQKYPKRPVGISEYGIGGNIFQQDIDKLEKPNGNYFPEPEQTKYHEITWDIIKKRDFVWGSFVWNMFDFSVAGWNRGGIPNLNHKGLVTYDRSVKKDAFYFYKANWSDSPVVHIVGKRNNVVAKTTNIKVYSNQKDLQLFINNEAVSISPRNQNKIFIFENAKLKKGKNTIKVTSENGVDEVVLKAI